MNAVRDGRIVWWDLFRFVAFLDIAQFHISGEHLLYGIGLPYFLLIACVVASNRLPPRQTGSYVTVRFKRLLIPWLFWSGVFSAYELAHAWRHHIPLGDAFTWPMLLGGPLEHMWFSPFIAAACIAGHMYDRVTQRMRLATYTAVALAAAFVVLWFQPLSDASFPFGQWGFAFASVPIGFGLGRILAASPETGAKRARALGYLIAFTLLSLIILQHESAVHDNTALDEVIRYDLALALIVLAVCLPRIPSVLPQGIESFLLGMYLLHVPIEQQILLRLKSGVSVPAWLELLALTFLSIAAVWALRRTPLRRFV